MSGIPGQSWYHCWLMFSETEVCEYLGHAIYHLQSCVSSKVSSYVAEVVVQFEHLGTVDALRVFVWRSRSLRNVLVGFVGRKAGQFVLQSDLNGVSCESDGTDSGGFGIASSNTANHEVCGPEVETRASDKRANGRGGIDLRLACDDLADLAVDGAVNIGEERRCSRESDVDTEDIEFRNAVPDFGLGREHAYDHDLGLYDILQCSLFKSDRLGDELARDSSEDGAQAQES